MTILERQIYQGINNAYWNLEYLEDPILAGEAYDLSERLSNGILNKINLEDILLKSAKEGIKLSQKRIKDYYIEPMFTEPGHFKGYEKKWGLLSEDTPKGQVYLDSPIGIGLFYKKEPNAVVSFIPNDFNTLKIFQLQLINLSVYEKNIEKIKRPRGLMPIDWKKTLIECTKELGKLSGYRQLSIISGNRNKWAHEGIDRTTHLALTDAFIIYDDTAKRLGFEKRQDGDWYISLD
jgi:hypothetical protein